MVRHVGHWLEVVEAVLIIAVLVAIAWISWQALSQAYEPVIHILSKL